MGCGTLICLRRGAVQCDVNEHNGEGTEGHCHGEERARMLQHGARLHFGGSVGCEDGRSCYYKVLCAKEQIRYVVFLPCPCPLQRLSACRCRCSSASANPS